MAEKLLNRSGGHDPCRGDGGAAWSITNPGAYAYAYDENGLMTTITRVLDGVTSVKTFGRDGSGRLSTESDWIAQ